MLKTRIITALVLTMLFSIALFRSSDQIWALLTLFATLLAVWEWSNLIQLNKQQTALNLACTASAAAMVLLSASLPSAYYIDLFALVLLAVATLFWLLLAPIWLLSRQQLNNRLLMTALGFCLLLATWLALIGLQRISPWLLLAVMATIWLADSAAYFAGKQFGRHKLAVAISPGKTWEGVAGAMLAVTLYGLLICYYWHISRWLIVALWFMVILSVMGDLFESLLKRQADVKDSSQLLPGHGGVLDRIDGLLPTLPVVLFYIYFPLFADLQLHVR
ncbi:MAG: phosphatidate cytidylyltransferase [Methylotenera sp.]|nr:phosphatidate cytidylyltransferase [Methylotenera sp.]